MCCGMTRSGVPHNDLVAGLAKSWDCVQVSLMAECRPSMHRLLICFLCVLLCTIYLDHGWAQEARPIRDPIVIQVIHLEYADAEHLAVVLAPLLSKEGRVVAYPPTNSLIIRDRASLVKKLVTIIKGKPDP